MLNVWGGDSFACKEHWDPWCRSAASRPPPRRRRRRMMPSAAHSGPCSAGKVAQRKLHHNSWLAHHRLHGATSSLEFRVCVLNCLSNQNHSFRVVLGLLCMCSASACEVTAAAAAGGGQRRHLKGHLRLLRLLHQSRCLWMNLAHGASRACWTSAPCN